MVSDVRLVILASRLRDATRGPDGSASVLREVSWAMGLRSDTVVPQDWTWRPVRFLVLASAFRGTPSPMVTSVTSDPAGMGGSDPTDEASAQTTRGPFDCTRALLSAVRPSAVVARMPASRPGPRSTLTATLGPSHRKSSTEPCWQPRMGNDRRLTPQA